MSINSQIQRIKNNILAAYSEIDNKGGTIPSSKVSSNLVAAIMSISTGGSGKSITISDSEALKNHDHEQIFSIDQPRSTISTDAVVPPSGMVTCQSSLNLSRTNITTTDVSIDMSNITKQVDLVRTNITCIQVEVS